MSLTKWGRETNRSFAAPAVVKNSSESALGCWFSTSSSIASAPPVISRRTSAGTRGPKFLRSSSVHVCASFNASSYRSCHLFADIQRTSWVCVTMATSLPSAVVIRVCQTIVRRPRWMGVVSPRMRDPAGAAPTKFVLLSMVVVVWPSGRLAIVANAPRVSAKAIIAPP